MFLSSCACVCLCPDTQENASHIARAVTVEYESLGRPLVTTEDAVRANSYINNLEPSVIKVGDAKGKYHKTNRNSTLHNKLIIMACSDIVLSYNTLIIRITCLPESL